MSPVICHRRRVWCLLAALGAPVLIGGLASRAWAQGGHGGHGGHGAPAKPGRPASAVPAGATPWGQPGDRAQVQRTIDIRMGDDMRFSPSVVTVRKGETVRLRVANRGKVMHELVIGTPQGLAQHAEQMRKQPHMAHDEPHMVHVKPGRTGEIVWQFTQAGSFQFACLIAGHFEAGMVGQLVVQ